MATVTMDVRQFNLSLPSEAKRLIVRFVPSDAAAGRSHVFFGDEVRLLTPPDGRIVTELAPTTRLNPRTWYSIFFDWFDRYDTPNWDLDGWSQLPGRLYVPDAGGDVTDLMVAPEEGRNPGYLFWEPPPGPGPAPGRGVAVTGDYWVDSISDDVVRF